MKLHLRSFEGRDTSDLTSVKAMVFGHLVIEAKNAVEHWRSDLFHDALWLDKHFDGASPFVFFWGVRDTGTSIGTDQELVSYSNAKVWRMTIETEGSSWVLRMDREV